MHSRLKATDVVTEIEPYRQIAAHVRSLIADGALAPGDWVPSQRDLAQDLGVARGTVERAYDVLVEQGIIQRRIGRGFFVCKDATSIASGRIAAITVEMAHLYRRLIQQGYRDDEIRSVAKNVLLDGKKKK